MNLSTELRIVFTVVSLFLVATVCGIPVEKWYKSQDGSVFYIEPEQKYNWISAWNECARKNMTLVAIDTQYKHLQVDALIRERFKPASPPPMWIGATDNAIDYRYEWTATGEIFTFTNWAGGQPSRGGEHCILIWPDWNWHDLTCTVPVGFICEEDRYLKEKNLEISQLKRECELRSTLKAPKYKNVAVYVNSNSSGSSSIGNLTLDFH